MALSLEPLPEAHDPPCVRFAQSLRRNAVLKTVLLLGFVLASLFTALVGRVL